MGGWPDPGACAAFNSSQGRGTWHCEFSGIARGSPSAEPIRARGGRGHWAPYRLGVGSSREGDDVDPPAGRSGGESRAVSEQEKTAGSSNRGSPGPVDFAMYSSAFFRVWRISSRQHGSLYRLRLSLSPRGVNTRNMAESDCIEDCGSGGRRSMTLETPTL